MKKWGAIFVAIAMLLSFTACNSSSKRNSDNTGGAKQTLKISFFKGGYGEAWLKAMGDKFIEKHPEVTISYEGDPGLTEKIGPRLESGANLPDLGFILQTNWQAWAIKGYLADLSDIYSTEIDNGKTLQQKLQPGIQAYGKINDKYWIVPWTDGATGIVYNAKMFEENGWQVPKTVDELYALLPQIKAKGIAPFAWGGKVMSYWDFPTIGWWAQYEGADGIEEYKKMEGSDVYGQEGRLKALQVFEKLVLDPSNAVDGAAAMDHIQSQMAFLQGKAAMIPNGAWIENEMANSMPDGFEMKMMQLPAIEGAKDEKVNNTMAGDFIIIPAKAKNVEMAKEFLKFMSTDEMLKLWTEKTGAVRPFVYDAASITGLSDFSKSVIDIWQNSKNIYMYSANPLYYSSLYNWPMTGAPYMIIYQEDSTAEQIFNDQLNYTKQNWESLKKQLGVQ